MTWTSHWFAGHMFLFFAVVLPGFCWKLMITNYSFLDLLITWVWFASSWCSVWSRHKHLTRRDLPAAECWFQQAQPYAENSAEDNISAKRWQLITIILGLPRKQIDASFSLVNILGYIYTAQKAEHFLGLTIWLEMHFFTITQQFAGTLIGKQIDLAGF